MKTQWQKSGLNNSMQHPIKYYVKKTLPWFIFAVALVLLHWRYEFNSDEGIVLNAAWDIINGKKMYVDTFEFMMPGASYLIAAWWKLADVSYTSARIISLAIIYSGLIGLYLMSTTLGIKRWRLLAPALFIISSAYWQPMHYNAFNTVSIIWALYFLLSAFKHNKRSRYFLSGLFSGLALLFLQHKGLALIGSLGAIISVLGVSGKISWRSILFFSLGAILPIVFLLTYWPPAILYRDVILFPLLHYQEVNTLPLSLWGGTLAAALLLSALVAHSAKNETKAAITALVLTGIFQMLASMPRADATHVLQALTPFLPICAILFELCLKKKHDKAFVAICFIFGVLALTYSNPPFRASASLVIHAVQKYCPEPSSLYAGPFMPGLYLATNGQNRTPYSFLITRHNTNEQFIDAANHLVANPPRCAVLNYAVVQKFGYTKNNPVDQFIEKNYSFAGEFRNIKILVKNQYAR